MRAVEPRIDVEVETDTNVPSPWPRITSKRPFAVSCTPNATSGTASPLNRPTERPPYISVPPGADETTGPVNVPAGPLIHVWIEDVESATTSGRPSEFTSAMRT